jgi:hypothetical protein
VFLRFRPFLREKDFLKLAPLGQGLSRSAHEQPFESFHLARCLKHQGRFKLPVCDPKLLLQQARENRIRFFSAQLGSDRLIYRLNKISSSPSVDSLKRWVAVYLVSQAHYVTVTAPLEIQRGAEKLSKTSRQPFQAFLKSEFGHHELMGKALNALGASLEEAKNLTMPETKLLVELLGLSFELGPECAAVAIDLFESTPDGLDHPVARFIRSSSLPVLAAQMLEAHRNINSIESHSCVSNNLIDSKSLVGILRGIRCLRFSRAMDIAFVNFVKSVNNTLDEALLIGAIESAHFAPNLSQKSSEI